MWAIINQYGRIILYNNDDEMITVFMSTVKMTDDNIVWTRTMLCYPVDESGSS